MKLDYRTLISTRTLGRAILFFFSVLITYHSSLIPSGVAGAADNSGPSSAGLSSVVAAAMDACHASEKGIDISAKEVIDRANKALRGESNHSRITMTVVTPNWSRELDIEGWNQGREKALVLIHAPPKDRGNATLRRKNEMWVWMPKVERVMKVPPTMMHSSWQGSDFTYEDIIKADSIVKDYTHEIIEKKKGEAAGGAPGYYDFKILATPKPDAPVVWGKVYMWARVYADCGVVPLREEDYNERGELSRTIKLSEIETVQGRRVPTFLECLPERKPGQKTSIKYRRIDFDVRLEDGFFSLSRLQRSRD